MWLQVYDLTWASRVWDKIPTENRDNTSTLKGSGEAESFSLHTLRKPYSWAVYFKKADVSNLYFPVGHPAHMIETMVQTNEQYKKLGKAR